MVNSYGDDSHGEMVPLIVPLGLPKYRYGRLWALTSNLENPMQVQFSLPSDYNRMNGLTQSVDEIDSV